MRIIWLRSSGIAMIRNGDGQHHRTFWAMVKECITWASLHFKPCPMATFALIADRMPAPAEFLEQFLIGQIDSEIFAFHCGISVRGTIRSDSGLPFSADRIARTIDATACGLRHWHNGKNVPGEPSFSTRTSKYIPGVFRSAGIFQPSSDSVDHEILQGFTHPSGPTIPCLYGGRSP